MIETISISRPQRRQAALVFQLILPDTACFPAFNCRSGLSLMNCSWTALEIIDFFFQITSVECQLTWWKDAFSPSYPKLAIWILNWRRISTSHWLAQFVLHKNWNKSRNELRKLYRSRTLCGLGNVESAKQAKIVAVLNSADSSHCRRGTSRINLANRSNRNIDVSKGMFSNARSAIQKTHLGKKCNIAYPTICNTVTVALTD